MEYFLFILIFIISIFKISKVEPIIAFILLLISTILFMIYINNIISNKDIKEVNSLLSKKATRKKYFEIINT